MGQIIKFPARRASNDSAKPVPKNVHFTADFRLEDGELSFAVALPEGKVSRALIAAILCRAAVKLYPDGVLP